MLLTYLLLCMYRSQSVFLSATHLKETLCSFCTLKLQFQSHFYDSLIYSDENGPPTTDRV